ncbi:hypothetical protein [Umezawaea sp. Da 62-37]|uniref:hypothetical protein n=1 Tax=Umezawaea sp. Da 62-37 TaxID=3075927 RepID=UPI0028F6C35C|nr:hypothetical protein [Umezawaea sp. Da 62-37]WNV88173.1 hypothetical protein RM788_07735 [Umezawaea sp. Da 62-37]
MPGSLLAEGRRAAAIPPPSGPATRDGVAAVVPALPLDTRWDHEPTTPDFGDQPPPPDPRALRPGAEHRAAGDRTPRATGTVPARGTASSVAGHAPKSARGGGIRVGTAWQQTAGAVPPFPSSFLGDGAAPPRPDAHHPS